MTAPVVPVLTVEPDELIIDALLPRWDAQLAEIRERLETASRLVASDSQKAAAMFRAIIDLYEHEMWAADAVAQARERLERMEMTNDE